MIVEQLSLFPYLEAQESPRPPDFIPIYTPSLDGREEQYVVDAVRSGWISSLGQYVTRFEDQFARFCGVEHAVSVTNGTVALHLALHALGIGPGDEVIVPSLTFVASANAVRYTGAEVVFADVEPDTWCIDVEDADTPGHAADEGDHARAPLRPPGRHGLPSTHWPRRTICT